MMRGSSLRTSAGLLTLITLLGSTSLGIARAADVAEPAPTWTAPEPAPLSPRVNAGAVPLSPETMLVFGGFAESGGWVAGAPVTTGNVPARDTGVLNVRTGAWSATAPLPAGVELVQPTVESPYNRAPVGSNGFAYALADTGLLRYDAAADRWDTLPPPPVARIDSLRAVDGRPIVLNFHPDGLGKDPAGAMLDTAGRWRDLPPLPSTTHGRNQLPWRDAVWAGGRLVISSGRDADKQIHLAALNVARSGDGWTPLPSARSPYPRPNELPPVAVAGRIVWPMVVYDLATGRSTPTPAAIRDVLQKHDGFDPYDTVPSMHILGDKVTLAGFAFDPVTATTTAIPPLPSPSVGASAAWVGGPSGLLAFGGMRQAGSLSTATNVAVRLLPAR